MCAIKISALDCTTHILGSTPPCILETNNLSEIQESRIYNIISMQLMRYQMTRDIDKDMIRIR